MSNNEMLKRVAALVASYGTESLDNPRTTYTVDEYTGPNEWIRHENIELTEDERNQIRNWIKSGEVYNWS